MKQYRFKRPSLFNLNSKIRYIAQETDHGYSMKISEKEWIGFPKRIVEKCSQLFELLGTPEAKASRKQHNRPRADFINHKNH